MKAPKAKPKVKLIGEDGNAFAIMGKVTKALRRAGADEEYIEKYMNESMKSNYDSLLMTAMEYADIR